MTVNFKVASGFLKADGSTFGEGPGDGHQGFIYGWNCNLNNKDSTRSRGTLWYKQKFPAKFDLMDDLVIPDRNGFVLPEYCFCYVIYTLILLKLKSNCTSYLPATA